MTREKADVIITAEVKAMLLAHDKPPTSIIASPVIGMFLPRNVDTVFDIYIVSIDANVFKEMKRFVMKLPGLLNVVMDGAIVNGKLELSRLLRHRFYFLLCISHFNFCRIIYTFGKG